MIKLINQKESALVYCPQQPLDQRVKSYLFLHTPPAALKKHLEIRMPCVCVCFFSFLFLSILFIYLFCVRYL